MSVSISNITYDPTVYVKENGDDRITVDFDVQMSCEQGDLLPTFTWKIMLLDDQGNLLSTAAEGMQGTSGGFAHVHYVWMDPPIHPGGGRPRIQVHTGCEIIIVEKCTGIHFRKGYLDQLGLQWGPKIETCEACSRRFCRIPPVAR